MKIKLSVLGVRGALPAANRDFMEYGGNTSCILLECGDEALCFDAGSGFADLCSSYSGAARLHVLLSHLHIDHIMGLYLLSASCVPEIHLYGGGENFKEQLDTALSRPYWPLALCEPKRIVLHEVAAGESFFLHGSDQIQISTMRANHPGHCLLYRADVGGVRVTHALDCEMDEDTFSRLSEFAEGSDLLIWDANFTDADKHPGWGHSTWEEGILLARAAGAKNILMTHYSREYTDSFLREQELLAKKGHSGCLFAREGMVIELCPALHPCPAIHRPAPCMTQESMKKILQIGVLLSSECNLNHLLDTILMSVMELANCDAGTLYLLDEEEEALRFKIMHTNSLGTHSGGDGKDPDLPPVPLRRENVCAYAYLEGRTIRIENVYTNDEYDFSGPLRYDSITGYHTESMLVVPMRNREGIKLGVLQLINALDDDGNIQAFPEEIVLAVESVASQAALTIQNVNYMREIRELFQSFVRVMSAAVDERSPYNANHSRRMAQVCERFLEFLNKRASERNEKPPYFLNHREELIMSVWLHDIGKVTTDLAIMNKPEKLHELQKENIRHRMEKIRLLGVIGFLQGSISDAERDALDRETREFEETVKQISAAGFLPDERLEWIEQARLRTYIDENGQTNPWLTEDECSMLSIRRGTLSKEERDHMESHVLVTDKLLSQIKFSTDLSHVREWAAAHHEMLNGSGYPKQLKGDEIPEEVRIISILDIFDALVADDRPYKPGMPVERALTILDAMANKEGKLDPTLTALFIESRCWEGIPLGGVFTREKTG